MTVRSDVPMPKGMDVAAYVVAILALGVLVIIHEGGHFLAAKWGGMKVSRFAVGFGPAIWAFERGGTFFQIGAIPFGGYVQIDGMSPEDGTDPEDPASFVNRPRHLRAAAILAGPLANYLLAYVMLLIFFMFGFASTERPPYEVLLIQEDSPAQAAGLQAGDRIMGMGGEPFGEEQSLTSVINASRGAPIPFDVERGDERMVVRVAPRSMGEGGPWRVGVAFKGLNARPLDVGPGEAVTRAGQEVVGVTVGIASQLAALFRGVGQLGGPIRIIKDLSGQVRRSGTEAFRWVAHLSIMLGFFNLLPIPALDGARLLFLVAGAVRRREIEPRLEAVVHGVGFLTLLGVMLVVSYFDIVS